MVGNAASGDELRNLRAWLLDEPEFRGRVTLRETPPQPGEMGLDVGELVLALAGASGAVLAEATLRKLGSLLITWLKTRRRTSTNPVEVTIRRPDGVKVIVTAEDAANDVAGMLDELVLRLGASLNSGGEEKPGDARPELPAG